MAQLRSADRRIARAAGVVMAGFVLSSVFGLLSQILITREFGTSADLDSFYAANRLPEILFTLMAGGALASAFIPTFTGLLSKHLTDRAWHLASSIANLILLILGVLGILAWLGAPWLVTNILAPGFEDPQQIEQTIKLLRIMLLSPLIFGLSGLMMGILNSHQRFLLPAFAPSLYRLGIIISVVFFAPRYGIAALAWGVVFGAGLHLLIQIPGLLRLGGRYYPSLGLTNPDTIEVGRLMLPRLLGAAVVQVNFLINTILASAMMVGSLSALSVAFMVMMMPQVVIAQAIAIAALPTFSEQFARGEMDQLRGTLANTIRGVFFLSFPAALGLVFLRFPIVSMLFERGMFDTRSTELVAWALLWYGLGLLGHSLLEIVTRAFYAMHDTLTPVLIGVGAMSLNIFLSIGLAFAFERIGWFPLGGLALANSLATGLEVLTLIVLLRRKLGGMEGRRLRRGLVVTLVSGVAMGSVLLIWLNLSQGLSAWLVGSVGVLLGLGSYWGLSLLLGSPEARQLPRSLLRRS
jgi:putative peptidoglycan lipid II flippase